MNKIQPLNNKAHKYLLIPNNKKAHDILSSYQPAKIPKTTYAFALTEFQYNEFLTSKLRNVTKEYEPSTSSSRIPLNQRSRFFLHKFWKYAGFREESFNSIIDTNQYLAEEAHRLMDRICYTIDFDNLQDDSGYVYAEVHQGQIVSITEWHSPDDRIFIDKTKYLQKLAKLLNVPYYTVYYLNSKDDVQILTKKGPNIINPQGYYLSHFIKSNVFCFLEFKIGKEDLSDYLIKPLKENSANLPFHIIRYIPYTDSYDIDGELFNEAEYKNWLIRKGLQLI